MAGVSGGNLIRYLNATSQGEIILETLKAIQVTISRCLTQLEFLDLGFSKYVKLYF